MKYDATSFYFLLKMEDLDCDVLKQNLKEQMSIALQKVRKQKPLVASITNSVTNNFVANAQLAIGGSAIIFAQPDEGRFLAKNCSTIYINLGLLLDNFEKTVEATICELQKWQKPWVLDPVGIGFGEMRTRLLLLAKKYPPKIIRGNATEIIKLSELWGLTTEHSEKSSSLIDSSDSVNRARQSAIALARFASAAVAVSGKMDMIATTDKLIYCEGGSEQMRLVSGFGCSLGGVCSTVLSCANPLIAALSSTQAYNFCGRYAEQASPQGLGHFYENFMDKLGSLEAQDACQMPFNIELL